MAVLIASQSDTAWVNALSITITKPSGLAVGDLIVAQIATSYIGSMFSVPSGFTEIRRTTTLPPSGFYSSSILYSKVADSGDVAASNFTWTFDNSFSYKASGIILRVTGQKSVSPITNNNGGTDANGSSPQSYAIGVTPTDANSLIILFFSVTEGAVDLSSYSIATDNPSWTEAYNQTTTSGSASTAAGAYATRAQTTATGNVSVSGLGSDDYSVAQIVVIAPSVSPPSVRYPMMAHMFQVGVGM